jgi:UDP-N-acetylglucosamine/UDP-N-acetylgalactosamine diphosphorylase
MIFPAKVKELMAKGVRIAAPFSVEIGDEVSPARISGQDVVFYSGTKIYGSQTLISAGAKIGAEGPATVVDCQLGREVELKGGFFQSSVFFDKTSMAGGAHARAGTLLEEEAKAGHTVGLKQTILFPFVTLGSLINFCDCLMAGGTGRNDHSEVGSSYVHFNYTPQQDKATPSLIGDVARGIMLDQPPIFLGGQGGMVGPLRIDYGTVITAGTVWRRDSVGAMLLHGGEGRPLRQGYRAGSYGDIRRKVYNNIIYIANLLALEQ